MGHEILYLDFLTAHQKNGREGLSKRLAEIIKSEKPDLLFCVLFTDEFDFDVIKRVSEESSTITLNWFCDDHWRFDSFSRHWAPAFNWITTTSQSAFSKYLQCGYHNAIKTQWACNHYLYRRLDVPLKYDVSFVGQPHGNRREAIDMLECAGVKVRTWGYGWGSGRLDQNQMIQVFNQSRVNLNLSNASSTGARGWGRISPRHMLKGLPSQIKARNFEVPGCGGFLLTDGAENLQQYYRTGVDVARFSNRRRLAHRIRYYLNNESERSRIATAGYERTLLEHTYVHRFSRMFATMGLRDSGSSAPTEGCSVAV
jgi:spore maturation protein CgeB